MTGFRVSGPDGIGLPHPDPSRNRGQKLAQPFAGALVDQASVLVEFAPGTGHEKLGIDHDPHTVVQRDLAKVSLGTDSAQPTSGTHHRDGLFVEGRSKIGAVVGFLAA